MLLGRVRVTDGWVASALKSASSSEGHRVGELAFDTMRMYKDGFDMFNWRVRYVLRI